jgi:hypothetical protein
MPDLFLEIRSSDEGDGSLPAAPASEREALALLADSAITASKLIPWGSNYSFAVALETSEGREQLAIYKPRSGEAPLYDFPDGTLYQREVAAYVLSRELGWNFVPPTIVREGPHGIGSVQLYIEPMPDDGSSREFWQGCSLDVERLVLFDHITNNADRKLGHCLRDRSEKVWGIDHGLTFNQMPKMRTVLWQFVGEPISETLLADLAKLRTQHHDVRSALRPFLSRAEIDSLMTRIDRMLDTRQYPLLNPRRNIPYGWW